MDAFLRRARASDAAQIIAVHIQSIRDVCSKDYSSEQIRAWAGRNFSTQTWVERIHKDFVWVLESDGFIEGFAWLEVFENKTSLLDALYLSKRVLGNGWGRKLMNEVLSTARSQGVLEIRLQSTLTALNFYEKTGFKRLEGGKSTVEFGGVKLEAPEMLLRL